MRNEAIKYRDINLFVDSLLSNSFYLHVNEWGANPNRVVFAKSVTPPASVIRRGEFRAVRPSSRRLLSPFIANHFIRNELNNCRGDRYPNLFCVRVPL